MYSICINYWGHVAHQGVGAQLHVLPDLVLRWPMIIPTKLKG